MPAMTQDRWEWALPVPGGAPEYSAHPRLVALAGHMGYLKAASDFRKPKEDWLVLPCGKFLQRHLFCGRVVYVLGISWLLSPGFGAVAVGVGVGAVCSCEPAAAQPQWRQHGFLPCSYHLTGLGPSKLPSHGIAVGGQCAPSGWAGVFLWGALLCTQQLQLPSWCRAWGQPCTLENWNYSLNWFSRHRIVLGANTRLHNLREMGGRFFKYLFSLLAYMLFYIRPYDSSSFRM